MNNLLILAYHKRDPISVVSTFLLVLGLFLISSFYPKLNKIDVSENEFIAMLDTPAPQAVQIFKEQLSIPKKDVSTTKHDSKRAQLEKSQEQLFENAVNNQNQNNSQTSKSESSNNQSLSKPSEVSTAQPKAVSLNQVSSVKYEAYVLAYLEKNKNYPTSRQARESRPEGTVKVFLDLNRLGQVVGFGVMQSSGSNLLDAEALKVIKFASLPPFPEESFVGETTHRFVANLKYSIINNGYQFNSAESN